MSWLRFSSYTQLTFNFNQFFVVDGIISQTQEYHVYGCDVCTINTNPIYHLFQIFTNLRMFIHANPQAKILMHLMLIILYTISNYIFGNEWQGITVGK